MTSISIVIVSYNTRDLLRKCLRSILETADERFCPSGLPIEIIVVDNASSDGTISMLQREFPDVQVIANAENVGFAEANNQGITIAKGDYILLLNPDTEMLPGALAALVHFMDMHPEAGAVGPRLLNADKTLQPSCHAFPNLLGHFIDIAELYRFFKVIQRFRPGGNHTQTCAVDWVTGACVLLRREAISQVGLLDEDYFLYAEEMDWCYRARELGWLTYFTPQAEVIHVGGGSSGETRGALIVELYRSLYLFYHKHRSAWSLRALKALVFALTVPKVLFLSLRQKGLPHRRELLQAYWRVMWLGLRREERQSMVVRSTSTTTMTRAP